jgi:3-hydroxyacyl-[acyl-carrier-protein] dehydratase
MDRIDPHLITEILPHRHPFLFIDQITNFNNKDSLSAALFLAPDLIFFKGHFPDNPIMPGVLVAEALAQTAGLLLGMLARQHQQTAGHAYLLAKTDLKYVRPALPGQTLLLDASLEKSFGTLFGFNVKASVENNIVAKGSLTLARQP